MINGIQIIIHYPQFMINTPENIGILQTALTTIASFEIIPGEVFEKYLYKLNNDAEAEPDFYHK
jgi:hypothetical protein